MNRIDVDAVNALRVLAADEVQKANSGHPGLPLGAAPAAYTVWAYEMKHNPKNYRWENRDRFILSGGHGSALLYALLHLFGYGLTKNDLENFRQLDSLTPGHPEYGHTVGVEATTGPLGAGMGMAVGMAIAEAHLSAVFNRPGYDVVDHYTFVLGGDGCLMEGISSEAFSLAGTLKLNKLIVLYDSNRISIEGSTDIAFTEDVGKRMEAFGFQVLTVEDGNDVDAIRQAIQQAKADKERPSFIVVKTQIGQGCPAKQGTAAAHGEPLGEQNIQEMKKGFDWPSVEPFFVPEMKATNVLFQSLQHAHQHMAILVDEHGGFSGIVTVEDLVESIVGDIDEEYDIVEPEIIPLGNDEYLLDGGLLLNDFNDVFETTFSSDDMDTMSGFLVECLGDLPQEGAYEEIELSGYRFATEEVRDNHIAKIRLKILPVADED